VRRSTLFFGAFVGLAVFDLEEATFTAPLHVLIFGLDGATLVFAMTAALSELYCIHVRRLAGPNHPPRGTAARCLCSQQPRVLHRTGACLRLPRDLAGSGRHLGRSSAP